MDWTGVAGKVADAFNDVVEQNAAMAEELARLRQVVGKEGKLKQRASLRDARGFWGESVESRQRADRRPGAPDQRGRARDRRRGEGRPVADMALEVDGRPLEGEFLRTAKTINTMVDQLGSFASEVTRVAREVGTEGKLGGQAKVKGVAGTWKDLTDRVNSMAGNLTGQVRNIADVTTAVAKGDLSKKITVDVKGEILELKNTINTMVDQLRSFASEVTRVAREVGTEGKLGGQARGRRRGRHVEGPDRLVNSMAGNLTAQVRNIAEVTTAVANGDLSQEDHGGREGRNPRAEEHHQHDGGPAALVRRRSDARGARGGHRRQAGRPGRGEGRRRHVEGPDRLGELHGRQPDRQVRNIAEVTTAVANGDLSKKITVDVKGEILELKNTINTMVDQLRSFAAEVTRVAREVGTEGKLGGQAEVQGVAGTWKDLTDSVNSMAGNLTARCATSPR